MQIPKLKDVLSFIIYTLIFVTFFIVLTLAIRNHLEGVELDLDIEGTVEYYLNQ